MTDCQQLMADIESIRCRVNDLPTRDYLQRHLSEVYWELHRLDRVQQSPELSVISQRTGGHIEQDTNTLNAHYDRV